MATLHLELGVCTSGHYAWRRHGVSKRSREDPELSWRTRAIHTANRGAYEAPRVYAELRLVHGMRGPGICVLSPATPHHGAGR